MSLWALSGTRTPEEQANLDNRRFDTQDPLKILLLLEERAIDDLFPIDLPTERPNISTDNRIYINMYIERHLNIT